MFFCTSKSCFVLKSCMSTEMHHCMYRSSRRKLTRLIHNIQSFHDLRKLCNNLSHEQLPMGPFGPMDLGQLPRKQLYPWPLARAIAVQAVIQRQAQGLFCHLPSFAGMQVASNACGWMPLNQAMKNNYITHLRPEIVKYYFSISLF